MTELGAGDAGVRRAVEILQAGGLVGLPTETVYGLAGRAFDPAACAAIFEAKGRPLSDPLIVHLPEAGWLERVAVPTVTARQLAAAFWPGPLTMVLPRLPVVPDLVTAGQSTVAVRVSAHPLFSKVLQMLDEPVAAPSANRFGRVSPTCAAHVVEELGGKVPLVLDGGESSHGIESTIALVHGNQIQILRPGPIGPAELGAFGEVSGGTGTRVAVPGSMASHYAPSTPLRLGFDGSPGRRSGLLAWSRPRDGFAAVEVLSANGNPREAAANLYAAIRRLDALGLEEIVAERPPSGGLGDAIADRLSRAAAKSS
ncbi:MAG: L-threonylcarbamoyladenylate synthase [Terrimicrobiaceae bacterium]